jgi:excisionase family DNA binding protein
MLTAEQAAAFVGTSRRTIYRWVEAEKLHFTETSDGVVLICLDALPT